MEQEGKDYFFVTKEKFEEWKANDMLLEYAMVYGEYKGIPKQQVYDALKTGKDVVLRIDAQGAATVKKLIPTAISIFIAAESEESLVERLVARNTESMEKLAVRVATARSEVARLREFDFGGCKDAPWNLIHWQGEVCHQGPRCCHHNVQTLHNQPLKYHAVAQEHFRAAAGPCSDSMLAQKPTLFATLPFQVKVVLSPWPQLL